MSARVDIAGVGVDVETERSTVERVLRALDRGSGGLLVTVNLDHVRRCRSDASYASLVREADLVVADGMPLVWASRVQGTPLAERVAGSNLVWSLTSACAAVGRSVFLLGGDPGAGEEAERVLRAKFPGLVVAGVLSPERGFEARPDELRRIERAVRESGAGVVFVALGSPKQEYLGRDLLRSIPGAWFVGCGISLSFVAGHVRRAPVWMQRAGLEWLHRLVQEPGRLARRYLVDGIPFALALLVGAVWRRLRRKDCRVPAPIGGERSAGRGGGVDEALQVERGCPVEPTGTPSRPGVEARPDGLARGPRVLDC